MENSKKLVVYYSYTGHTKMIAKRNWRKVRLRYFRNKAYNSIFYKLPNSSK